MTEQNNLVVGGGYLGQRVARRWQQNGTRVYVTTRSTQRAESLAQAGFSPLLMDVLKPDTWSQLPDVLDQVCYCVGFDASAGASRQAVYVDGLRHVLERLPRVTDRLIYISSTGVYAQADDEWVDENSPCDPVRDGGVACLAAEQTLRRHPLGDRAVILRLAGLYGPARIPYLDKLRRGEPLPVAATGYLNLVHVEDATEVVMAASTSELPELYLVADGSPVRREDYYREVARQLDVELTFTDVDLSLPQAQRSLASKRICVDKLRHRLPIKWKYSNYREGLAASLIR